MDPGRDKGSSRGKQESRPAQTPDPGRDAGPSLLLSRGRPTVATRAAGCPWHKEEGLGERMGKAVGVN